MNLRERISCLTKNAQTVAPLTWEQVQQERNAAEQRQASEIERYRRECKTRALLGRSGIAPLHQGCRFDNFKAETPEQATALTKAKAFANGFDDRCGGGFVFSGNCGTGKNHLAAAIANTLLAKGKPVVMITVNELMMRSRECYGTNARMSEAQFVRQLVEVPLLVIDELGLQRNSDAEKLLLNTVIDQRLSNLRPTGLLTNLNYELLAGLLGERIMDRIVQGGCDWVAFTWESYRSRVDMSAVRERRA